MVMEEKARMEQRLIPSGHQMVNLRLRAHFGEPHWLAEKIGGISYLFFLRELSQKVQAQWTEVRDALESIRKRLLSAARLVVNVTLDEENYKQFRGPLDEFLALLPNHEAPPYKWQWSPPGPQCEGLLIPSQVNYVGKASNLYELGYRFHGSALVISRYLRTTWLWEKIRVEGGAYGAFCLFDRPSGILSFVSYRDPNLEKTLVIFDQTASFLERRQLDGRELTRAIVGTIGDLDAPMLPDAKGYTSMLRYLMGDSEEVRQQMREEVLDTSPEQFREFAQVLDGAGQKGIVKVMGSPGAIEEANRARPGWLSEVKIL